MSILAGGLVAAGGAGLAALLVLSARFRSGAERLGEMFLLQAIAIGALGGFLALALIAEGVRLRRGIPPAPFRLRRSGWLWLAFGVLLLAGTVASLLNTPPFLMALFHVPTLLLLPVLVLSAVGWGLRWRGGSWSDVGGGLLGGALLGVGMAVCIESIVALLLGAGLFAAGLLPSEWLQESSPAFTSGDPMALVEELAGLINPPLILVALAFMGGVVPMVEEVVKTLGVGVAGFWLRPDPRRAFLLGVASGAGFALVENILNSFLAGPFWGPGVVARLMATVMHCATGGLTGWGWGQLWARRPGRFLLAFAGAGMVHSLWNSVAVGMVLSGLMVLVRSDQPLWMMAASLMMLALMALEALLAGGVIGALLWAARRLGR